jgi:hypothetical protein
VNTRSVQPLASTNWWTEPPAGRAAELRRRACAAPSWPRRRWPVRPSVRTPA